MYFDEIIKKQEIFPAFNYSSICVVITVVVVSDAVTVFPFSSVTEVEAVVLGVKKLILSEPFALPFSGKFL